MQICLVLAVFDFQLVVERQLHTVQPALEHAAGVRGHKVGAAAVRGQHAHGTRGGAERADDDAAVPVRVRAEEGMGIGRGARTELVGVGHPVFLTDLCRG
jgi:hypothetical protein